MADGAQGASVAHVDVQVINGFVDDGKGGNPAGVVYAADDLTEAQMQAVARRAGYSETVFVSASRVADFRFDFFTPTRRIAHCGHATIAAFAYMAEVGRIGAGRTSKETVDGPREVVIEDGMAFMEQTAPVYTPPGDEWAVADALAAAGLAQADLAPGYGPMAINNGNSFLVIPVKDTEVLGAMQPDMDQITAMSEALGLIGFYVFSEATIVPGRHASARMFAPAYGIPEESATGMAAGPLACYLHDVMGVEGETLLIEQGHFMAAPAPSILTARLNVDDAGAITGLMVGGRGKSMDTIRAPLPDTD